MELQKIYFEAELMPVEQYMPGFQFDNDITHCVIVKPEEGIHRVVNFCSKDYNLQTNQQIVEPFLQEVTKHFQVETRARMRGFSQFFIDIIFQGKPVTIRKGDLINPMIRLTNSYDGKVKYQFQLFINRVVCSNGLTIPEMKHGYKLMHTAGLSDYTSYEKILGDVSEFMVDFKSISEKFQELLDQPVKDLNKRIESVIEETGFPSSYLEEVMHVASTEMAALETPQANDWVVYNAFNNILNHSQELKAKESKKEEMDREVFEYLYNY